MMFSRSDGFSISPMTRIFFLIPLLETPPPETVLFSYFTALMMSSKLTFAEAILYISTAISTSLSSAPRMAASLICGSRSMRSSKYSAYSLSFSDEKSPVMLMFKIGTSSAIFKSKTVGSTFPPPSMVGHSVSDFTRSTLSFTFCLASSTEISSSNSTKIIE